MIKVKHYTVMTVTDELIQEHRDKGNVDHDLAEMALCSYEQDGIVARVACARQVTDAVNADLENHLNVLSQVIYSIDKYGQMNPATRACYTNLVELYTSLQEKLRS